MTTTADRLAAALAERYRIERELGSGGMATVYLAHDLRHGRQVAVKVLHPELAAVVGAERFLREIAITARLDHPHILTLIDSGVADALLYYVLPFVRGESLRERLRREKQLGLDDAIRITRDIGSALEYAHRQGVVHRDVKPENILIHEGEAVLADFGIALAVKEAGGARLTRSGLSPGTPQYMSPEQASGDQALDARSDQYSLAALVYEMLVGMPPHSGPNVQAIVTKVLTQRPVMLRALRETVPVSIESAVDKALAKLPADRFATVDAFVQAITAPATTHGHASGRRWWRPIAVAGAFTAITLLAVVSLWRSGPASLDQPDTSQLSRGADSVGAVAAHPSAVEPESSKPSTPARTALNDATRDAATGDSLAEARSARTAALEARRSAVTAGATAGDLARGDASLDMAEAMLREGRVTGALRQLIATQAAWTEAERSRRNARAEIEALIRDYSRAVEWRDPKRMSAAFPELTRPQQDGWAAFFRASRAVTVELAITELRVERDTAYADLKGTYVFIMRNDGRTERHPVSFSATLTRVAGAWRMSSVQ
jgi:serine/threonine protein kinase